MNLRRNILSGSDGALASRSNFLLDLLCSTRLINRISACNRQNKQSLINKFMWTCPLFWPSQDGTSL